MQTYLIHVYYAGTMQEERYVNASSVEVAIAKVRESYDSKFQRFLNVFA